MRDVVVIYGMPDRILAVTLPECAVDAAKRNGRAAGGPVIAVIRPKLQPTYGRQAYIREHQTDERIEQWQTSTTRDGLIRS